MVALTPNASHSAEMSECKPHTQTRRKTLSYCPATTSQAKSEWGVPSRGESLQLLSSNKSNFRITQNIKAHK